MPAQRTGPGRLAPSRLGQARPGGAERPRGAQEIYGKMDWHERTV